MNTAICITLIIAIMIVSIYLIGAICDIIKQSRVNKEVAILLKDLAEKKSKDGFSLKSEDGFSLWTKGESE